MKSPGWQEMCIRDRVEVLQCQVSHNLFHPVFQFLRVAQRIDVYKRQRSNSAKLVPGTGGKDVDSVIGVSRYLVKYQ